MSWWIQVFFLGGCAVTQSSAPVPMRSLSLFPDPFLVAFLKGFWSNISNVYLLPWFKNSLFAHSKKVLQLTIVVTFCYFPIWLILHLTSVAGHQYETRVGDTFVISSNDAIMSCSLPSFASEYLSITSWVTSEGVQITKSETYGKL